MHLCSEISWRVGLRRFMLRVILCSWHLNANGIASEINRFPPNPASNQLSPSLHLVIEDGLK